MRSLTVALIAVFVAVTGCGGEDLHEEDEASTTTTQPAGPLPPAEAMARYCEAVEAYAEAAAANPTDPAVQQQGQEVTAQGQALAEQAAVDPTSVDLAELQRCQAPLAQVAPPPE